MAAPLEAQRVADRGPAAGQNADLWQRLVADCKPVTFVRQAELIDLPEEPEGEQDDSPTFLDDTEPRPAVPAQDVLERCRRSRRLRDHHVLTDFPDKQLAARLTRLALGARESLSEQGVIRDWIAESRVRLEQLRLLVLKTAWLMDTVGNRGAHTEIQAIKIATPATVQWILDKAIQVHGGAGVSGDTPLAMLWANARTLRLADGPDEVHERSLARSELRRQQQRSRKS